MKSHPMSESLLEISAEMIDPAKWVAMMLLKPGKPATAAEAYDRIIELVNHALARAVESRESPWIRNTPETRPPSGDEDFTPDYFVWIYSTIQDVAAWNGVEWNNGRGQKYEADDVKFWMPIPATPKEGM